MSIPTRFRASALSLALSLLAGAASLAAAPALAAEGRSPIGSPFGSFQFHGAADIAVDQSTGNVYVAAEEQEVQVFGPEGGPPIGGGPSSFNGSGTPSGSFKFAGEEGIAIAGGKVYVADEKNNVFDEFAINGASGYGFLCQITGYEDTGVACVKSGLSNGAPFEDATGVTVDTAGDLYVASYYQHAIYEYNPAGEEIRTLPTTGGSPALAVSASGSVYYFGTHEVFVVKRSSLTGGPEKPEPERVLSYPSLDDVVGGAIDLTTGHLLVAVRVINGNTGGFVQELDASNKVVRTFGQGVFEPGTVGDGVAVDEATEDVYVLSNNKVQRFGPVVQLPDVSTGATSAVRRTSAQAHGTVNPDGKPASYFFQYSEVSNEPPSYGSATAVTSAGSGSGETKVSATLTGLEREKSYNYRLVTENANGRNYGENHSFTTATAVDGVVTDAASGVEATAATLNGALEPDGLLATDWFEYGPSKTYGASTPPVPAGEASEETPASANLTGLVPNTTYHYRLTAENSLGTDRSSDATFATPAIPPVLEGATSASGATRATVLVHATVNPEHSATSYIVKYVEGAGYEPGGQDPYASGASTAAGQAGAELGGATVEQVVGGLKPNTTYHYQVVASNQAGRVASPDATFTTGSGTPPLAGTGGASGVTQNDATISGTVDTEGLPTSYGFEIGTEAGVYGPPTGLGSVGGGAGEAGVSLGLTGLVPGTTYHYRLTASNVDGASYGADETFTTTTFANAFIAPPAPLPFVTVALPAFPAQQANAPAAKPKPKHKPKPKRKKARSHRGRRARRRG